MRFCRDFSSHSMPASATRKRRPSHPERKRGTAPFSAVTSTAVAEPAAPKQTAKSAAKAEPAAPKQTAKSAAKAGILFPLDFVYARSGVELPKVEPIDPDDIPPPYRSLLVHTTDMTLTLERHFGGRVVLRPLGTLSRGPWYFRRVLLAQEYTGRPVEMGAIRIKVGAFSDQIRSRILQNTVPLGRILRDGGVQYESRPTMFLAVTPNPEMMGVFWMREPRTLYGRRTEMIQNGTKIGDIVEILPLV
jgi:chorismate-pyruvate lyase